MFQNIHTGTPTGITNASNKTMDTHMTYRHAQTTNDITSEGHISTHITASINTARRTNLTQHRQNEGKTHDRTNERQNDTHTHTQDIQNNDRQKHGKTEWANDIHTYMHTEAQHTDKHTNEHQINNEGLINM